MKKSQRAEIENARGTSSDEYLGLTFWTFGPFLVIPEFI
jgi:hypothetical protein